MTADISISYIYLQTEASD